MELRCAAKDFTLTRVSDDGKPTITHAEQSKVEESIENCFTYFRSRLDVDPGIPKLDRDRHATFLLKGLQHLSQSYECLDASRPWLCYWILHSLELLQINIPEHLGSRTVQFLAKCQDPEGGFAGGPGQAPHLAPTYAAVNALCIIGTQEAYDIIDRPKLQDFLLSRHCSDGSFTMHEGGEVDIRGAYCAASAAKLTNIMIPQMFELTAQWIVSCQTYEGGFAGLPGMEAHGGYSFCGLAALIILNKQRLCDQKALLRWTVRRQMAFEGGFQGRTNKLVDGCYSFWQGGAFPLLHMIFAMAGDKALSSEKWMCDQGALQEYILICCQHPAGGLIDKPGKPRDYYHTCYCLSGLSVAQHFMGGKLSNSHVIGNPDNDLKPTHPIYNIGLDFVLNAMQYFKPKGVPNASQAPNSTAT